MRTDAPLNFRYQDILTSIVRAYIDTGEPVGSRTISKRRRDTLSPASIRNVMADLEEMGYLCSPHTSAGRVPTEKAYRLYVDSLLAVGSIGRGERDEIRRHCRLTGKDVGAALREVSAVLSSISHYMGIVAAPSFTASIFRHIEFVRLSGRRILVILVSQNGTVQNKIVEVDEELASEELVRMANYLNGLLQGLTIAQVKNRILEEMRSDKSKYDIMLSTALKLSQQTIPDNVAELFIEGQANILELPEFADVTRMKDIFRTFEQKGQLLELLDRSLAAPGVNIFIGTESHLNSMAGMSMITSTYATGKNTLGVVGVVGPTRMGYSKVIPIVDYTARMVSRLLDVE